MRRAALSVLICLTFPAAAAAADDAIIVKRASGLDRAERAAVRSDAGVKLVDALMLPDTEVVRPRDGDVAEALKELNADPDVLYAERDRPVRLASNDALYDLEWGLPKIDAIDAWTRTQGAGAAVAVVNTGFDLTHPDLAGQFTGNLGERGNGRETNGVDDDHNGLIDDWQGWDFYNGDNAVEPQSQDHGTHVAGTIAALTGNGVGVAGVAPASRILPLKVFGGLGTTGSESRLAEAFAYAGRLGTPVVNASLGGWGYSTTITNVIKAYPNTLFVIAAGNDGADAGNYYPCNANAANAVCVGASDQDDDPASFSNRSATAVDLFAPGVDIASTVPGGYAYMDGTSMATPHVAGVAALLAASKPGAGSTALKTALMSSVDAHASLAGLSVTGGRLNAHAALDALAAPAPPAPTPTPDPPAPTPPTPTPVPPVTPPTPVAPIPTPAPVTPVVSSLAVTGTVTARKPARVTYVVTGKVKVSLSVRRAGTGTASSLRRWSETAKAGTRTFTLGRRVGGRTLKPGKYTLTVSTTAGSRSVSFRVR